MIHDILTTIFEINYDNLKAQPEPIQDNDKYPGVPGGQTKSNSVSTWSEFS